MEMIMSTISTATERHYSAGGSLVGRIAAAFKRLWVAYITWRVEQAAMAHLRSMSDRELEDLGLSRSQIEGAVGGERASDHALRRYY
jgi:uncharacterized protein YjiS (DUF1127 family)